MNPPIRVYLRESSDVGGPETMKASAHHLTDASPDADPAFAGRGDGPDLRVHRDLEALDSLEEAWRNLTPSDAAPFLTFSWNQAWYRSYAGPRMKPLLFELVDGDETVAILPCYRDGSSIRLAGDRICDYQDILAADDAAVRAMLREVMAWVAREGSGDHLHFEKLSSEGALHRVLHLPGATPAGTLSFEKSYAPCPFADLGDGLEGYLSSLPRRTRQDLRNSLSRLQREAPGANVRVVRDLGVKIDDLETAADFHVVHFTKAGRSPLGDPRLVEFFGRVAKDPDVGLQLAFLEHDGALLAVDFGFVRGPRYYGYLMAYDPASARLSPGKCLLLLRIDRWVKEDGVRILDFLAGDESYKRAYTGGRAYRVWSMRLMPPSLRHRALHLGLRSDRRFREFAKKLLGRNRVASA
jgi:CelD/BcsL family acetyltransferase involved in cellulose biosynthesis